MAATRTYFARYPHVWHDRSTRPRLTTMSLETIDESLEEVDALNTEQVKTMLQSASRAEAITKALFEQVNAPDKPGEKETEEEESHSSAATDVAISGSNGPSTWPPTTPGCIDCNLSPSPSHNHSNNIGWTSFEDINLDARTLAEYGIRSPRVKSRRSRFHYADHEEEHLTRNEPWIKRFSYLEDGMEAARGFQRRADMVVDVGNVNVGGLPAEAEIEELVLPPPILPLPQKTPAPVAAPHLEEELERWSLDVSTAAKEDEVEGEITPEEHLCLFCPSVVESESEEDSEYSEADEEIRQELEAVNWDFEQWALGGESSDTDGEEATASTAAAPAAPAGRCGGLAAAETAEIEGAEAEEEEREEEEEKKKEDPVLSAALLANFAGISFLIASIGFGL
ncbi:hypothetical protein COL5a_004223 [Colletotrichum fioriniae]|nr:hypothetical protein COL5a_004223 [Colletotrichum fioriniae]